ncbi:hypothetical protein NOC27_2765 [Nitrosococcus oceani AFC27]|nr:hypothetical protein NOC27_2765 [Nitrosococcus oceani AFC27]
MGSHQGCAETAKTVAKPLAALCGELGSNTLFTQGIIAAGI